MWKMIYWLDEPTINNSETNFFVSNLNAVRITVDKRWSDGNQYHHLFDIFQFVYTISKCLLRKFMIIFSPFSINPVIDTFSLYWTSFLL